MKLEVKGLSGIDRADVEIREGAITLLAGKNHQGKSSLINMAAAVLLPRAFPPGTTKTEFGRQVVNDAHKDGYVKFESGHGIRRITYPKGEIHTLSGTGLHCDEWSTQQWTLHSLDPKDRAKQLNALAGTTVTRDRVEKELQGLNVDPEKLKALVDTAMNIGFDVASETAKGWARELKGEYKATSGGTQWGSDQAVKFRPDGWEHDLEQATEEKLNAELKAASAAFHEAMAKQIAFEHAGDKGEIAKEIESWTEKLAGYEQSITSEREKLEKHRASSATVTCSGCGLVGIVEQSKLVKKQPAELSTDAYNAAKKDLANAEAGRNNAQVALGIAKGKFDNAQDAGESIDVTPFSNAMERASKRLSAFVTHHKCLHLHYRIIDMLKAADTLSPDGLPKTALLEGVKAINAKLADLCATAEWGRVEIDSDLKLRYNGRVYHRYILSESERFRCDVTFQVLWALMKRHELVLIDEAEKLDADGRNGLFSLLATKNVTALVAMMVVGPPPDLEQAGVGVTYWVERGTANKLNARVNA